MLKIYKRFLKEEGIYKRAIDIHTKANKRTLKEALENCIPSNWICSTYAFCEWSNTKEGQMFWEIKNFYWRYKCLQNKILGSNHPYLLNVLLYAASSLLNQKLPQKDFKRISEIQNNLKEI